MRQLGLRRILPLAALAIYAALVWFGCPHVDLLRHGNPNDCAGVPWSGADELAYGLNLPAAMAWDQLDPLIARLSVSCAAAAVFKHAGTALFVPLLWFLVGWRIERWKEFRTRPYTFAGKVAACFIVFLLTAIGGLVPVGFIMASVSYPVFSCCMFAWPAFGVAATVSRLRGTSRSAATV